MRQSITTLPRSKSRTADQKKENWAGGSDSSSAMVVQIPSISRQPRAGDIVDLKFDEKKPNPRKRSY